MYKRLKMRIFSFFIIFSMLLGMAGGAYNHVIAADAAGAIAYLGSLGSAVSKTSGTSLVVNTTAPVSTGDDIIITYATDPNSSLVISVADTAGNSYSQVGYVVNSGQLRTYVLAACNVNSMPSGSSITITASPAVTARAAVIGLFRGLTDSSPLDQTHTGTGSGTAPSSGASSTTTQADELLIGAIGTEGPDGDAVGTWDGSFTNGPRLGTTGGTDDANITASMGFSIVSATGEYTASISGITSRDWAAMIATFKVGTAEAHPAISTAGTPLNAFSSLPGSPSAGQTYTVSGSDLTDAITITAPADFEISLSSGSGFVSSLVLSPLDGSVPATPIFVRFNRAAEGTSTGYLTHTSSGATTRDIAVSGTAAPLSPVSFNILLGRPTNVSVTANIIPDQDVEFYIEYGTTSGIYSAQTETYTGTANEPIEFVVGSLTANTRYYYHIVYRRTGTTDWNHDTEHSFITQRPSGSTFTFTVASDSHLGQYGGQTVDEKALYQQTLLNVAADHPDFHIDTGDTFAMDPTPLGTGMTDAEAEAAYLVQRPYLGLITDSIPFFLALGNHENEEGWNFDDVFPAPDQSLARVGLKYRKEYYPNPVPDAFYSGNTDPLDTAIGGDTNREDYYAWTWGDALFVVLDPYQYSMVWPSEGDTYGGEGQDGEVGGTRWDWTLGIKQYLWLKSTLENSTAKYKFVFAHQVTGGATPYGRGGISAAPYFEWGGENADGTWGFDVNRPASEGWTLPIHQLMVANGVNIFFHGHDHIYSFEQLDGIDYVECPKPDDAGYAWDPYGYGYTEGLYPDGVDIQNSGYLRVSVSPTETKVEYVRSYLPGDGTNGIVAHSFTVSGTAPTSNALAVTKPGTGSGTVTSSPIGIDCGSTCSANFGSGTSVTLSAVAAVGSTFTGWGGACSGAGACSVSMDAAKSITATFVSNNLAPVAVDDAFTSQKNVAMTIDAPGVLSNDTDANLDTLAVSIVTDPSHGALIPNANGAFTYTPTAGFTGNDTFTYQAYDGVLYSNTATVTIHVIDTVPPGSPSRFYGNIYIFPIPPAAGDIVQAYVSGATSPVATTTIPNTSPLSYTINVPGDIPGTTVVEGGAEGGVVTFKINGWLVATGTWHAGSNVQLDFNITEQSIALVAGWNLISFNLHPSDTNISSVLSSIKGNYNLVYAWDASGNSSGSGNWLKYDNIPMSTDTLLTLDEKMGFWIHMTSADTLKISGTPPTTTNISLEVNAGGWNLVAYPSASNMLLPDALSDHGVGPDYTLVYAYHPADTADPWKVYDRAVDNVFNDLKELASDYGYWVKVGGTHTWDVGY